MRAIGERVRAYGLPFVIGGDFQNNPAAMRDSGWPNALSATVVSGGVPTCFPNIGRSFQVTSLYFQTCLADVTPNLSMHLAL